MGKKSAKAPAPDPAIGQAATVSAETSREWLQFSREQYAADNVRQDKTDALTERVVAQQMALQDRSNAWATEDRARYKSIYQPMEDEYAAEANNWDSPERQAQMAAEAKADVLGSAAQAQEANTRQMASMGINPNSGRFAGVDRANDTQTALAAAGAQNNARTTARSQGMAMKADALNIGKGLPSQAATAAGLSLNSGNSAMGNQIAGQSAAMMGTQIMGQGYQGAMAGAGQQASILNQQYQGQLSSWGAQQQADAQGTAGLWSGLGTAAGVGMMMFSSKDFKENKQPVDGALSAINSMPVEEWDYKEGMGDGGRHIGPYAEDFQRATGKGDGKTIPVIDAIGVTVKAVQELDQKIEQLGRRISRPKKQRGKA